MAIHTADPSTQAVERELTNYQRSLVDTCFEEGNFDSAIALLHELALPGVEPCPAHVRNAVYIALYPPPSAEDEHDASRLDVIPASPSKFAARNPRSSSTPSPAASEAAQRLLRAYARTNSPATVLRALPNYGLSGLPGLTDTVSPRSSDDDNESEIYTFSRRVKDAKSCWELLREGFVKRDGSSPSGSTAGPRRSRRGHRNGLSDDEDESPEMPAPVGEQAWPILEWLLVLFEKDQAAVSAKGQPPYSPLLLSQLPPNRSASGSRWDVEAPLDVVFFSLQQEGRFSLGVRLLGLLVNLTATVFVDLPMITNAVCTRTMGLTSPQLSKLFASLPSTEAATHFKVSLCTLCLAFAPSNGGRKPRPKPQARTGPRPTPRQRGVATDDTAAARDGSATAPTATEPEPTRRTFFTPPTSDVLELLRSPLGSRASSADITCHLKFQLVTAYAALQAQLPCGAQDPAWREALEGGALAAAVDAAFAGAQNPEEAHDLRARLAAKGLYR